MLRPRRRPPCSVPAVLDKHYARKHAFCMHRTIQIRNVPDDLHRRLKARAALEGMSLSEYLLNEVRLVAERPSLRELRRSLAERSPVNPSLSPAEAVREERDSR